jgi:hypothetical protein
VAQLTVQIAEALDPARASALARVVELEADWEALRTGAAAGGAGASVPGLRGLQRAYEAYRTSLVAYNARYGPAFVSEGALNTPARLGDWCRVVRAVLRRAEPDPGAVCPVRVVEKAYRWADRLASRRNGGTADRGPPPDGVGAAVHALGAVILWCDGLADLPGHPQPVVGAPPRDRAA